MAHPFTYILGTIKLLSGTLSLYLNADKEPLQNLVISRDRQKGLRERTCGRTVLLVPKEIAKE